MKDNQPENTLKHSSLKGNDSEERGCPSRFMSG